MTRDFSVFFKRYGWPTTKGRLPFCIGHRGASGHERENTITAFRRAAELGAEMWELDTQLTKDGVVVVSHDDHLERVFGIDHRISEMTAAELAGLDGVDVPSFRKLPLSAARPEPVSTSNSKRPEPACFAGGTLPR